MPIHIGLNRGDRIVRIRAKGALADREILATARRMADLFADATLDASWIQIADVNDVECFDGVSSQGIRKLASLNPWPEDSLRVIVAPTDLGFGLGRMYEMLLGETSQNLCVVRSEAEAQARVAKERGC
jgi:hypothetical protein